MAEENPIPKEDDFEIRNELEFLIQSGRDGMVSLRTIFQASLRANLWMVLNRKLEPGDSLSKVQSLMATNEEGEQLLTLFTGKERCEGFLGKREGYEYPTPFPAPMLLDNMGENMGLVINPGLPVGIQISAEGVKTLKREVGRGWLENIPEAPEGDEQQQIQ
ncbi:hypothetical protein J2T60_001330 [Natronospira proteinivora]|uniref:SseB protein N-terminal domain-containing protein n=1 Tax=Natronospira proteinivora TaxID=1807133 RepID=A0ABT1G7U5_9GAMM|nr:SseB family protein [Natronospira proteinivora]MCP1727365.1 hypothetical protein [Natronospira proteinivora]